MVMERRYKGSWAQDISSNITPAREGCTSTNPSPPFARSPPPSVLESTPHTGPDWPGGWGFEGAEGAMGEPRPPPKLEEDRERGVETRWRGRRSSPSRMEERVSRAA